ncbi:RagB/SusD family nutrient uptake outer membrane protein [Reichenbachiella ulvae]|uniref:RagB/SusD family nutrient uptake outer membrane protein n=1 Tax=Reichenbachiella ulvae TaxID=2980104 RepID=A0ABT3D040_9BACT|nr:RagB/SusD family nutrient uptake outer membrane protein [Reichenbachiella ulvae]MCV9388828.1 RagB/SusD family nutrient uptake outer membrane protein [Reichenbachiella ulvae]
MKAKEILIALIVLMTMGCEDFLEPESLSTYDQSLIFSNVDDARMGVNAIYVQFGVDGFRSRLSNNMTGNTDIEHSSGWGSTSDRYQIWDLNPQENNGDLGKVWSAAYTAIRDANIAIEGLLASPLLSSSDQVEVNTANQLLGEAYTLRAYWYSMLIYYFGDVPFSIEAPKAGQNFFLERTDRNEILTHVINDLIEIEEDMQWADQTRYGIEQVNREFTLGLIARLALQRGGYYLTPEMSVVRDDDYLDYYEIARNYTQKLMNLKDRELPTDFRQIFLNQAKFISPVNDEVLFEIPFALGNGDVGWNIGIDVEGGNDAAHDYGSGNNYMRMPLTYYCSFDTTDLRRDVTCGLYKINKDGEPEYITRGISQAKWSRWDLDDPPGASTAKGTGINWPMMRYADVLLMFAEAENELNGGPTAAAKDALKRVRARAFNDVDQTEKVDQYVDNLTTKEAFFDALVDERAWEFGGEMIRKYELIRWGIYSEKMAETVQGLKDMADYAFDNTGPLADSNLPIYIYWKLDESGNFVILNRNTNVVLSPEEQVEWNQEQFLLSLHDDELGYDEWITRDWANYIDGPVPGVVRYIFPLPADAISSSQGTLDNSGYEFGL